MTNAFDLITRLFEAKRSAALLLDKLGFNEKAQLEMSTIVDVAINFYMHDHINADQFSQIKQMVADFLGVTVK